VCLPFIHLALVNRVLFLRKNGVTRHRKKQLRALLRSEFLCAFLYRFQKAEHWMMLRDVDSIQLLFLLVDDYDEQKCCERVLLFFFELLCLFCTLHY